MQKHIEQIDRKTGEVMQGCMVYLPYRPKLTERWFMAFQDTFIEIAKDQDLTLEPKNVLFYLFGKLISRTSSNRHKQKLLKHSECKEATFPEP